MNQSAPSGPAAIAEGPAPVGPNLSITPAVVIELTMLVPDSVNQSFPAAEMIPDGWPGSLGAALGVVVNWAAAGPDPADLTDRDSVNQSAPSGPAVMSGEAPAGRQAVVVDRAATYSDPTDPVVDGAAGAGFRELERAVGADVDSLGPRPG